MEHLRQKQIKPPTWVQEVRILFTADGSRRAYPRPRSGGVPLAQGTEYQEPGDQEEGRDREEERWSAGGG
jgi:hypothetical protein